MTKVIESRCMYLRQHERVPVLQQVTYTDGHRIYTEFIKDISLGGIKVESSHPMKVGSVVTVTIDTNPPLKLKGRVMWCRQGEDGYEAGIQFAELSPKQQLALKTVVQTLIWDKVGIMNG